MAGVWTRDKVWGSRLGYTHCGALLPVQTLGRVRIHSKANKKIQMKSSREGSKDSLNR